MCVFWSGAEESTLRSPDKTTHFPAPPPWARANARARNRQGGGSGACQRAPVCRARASNVCGTSARTLSRCLMCSTKLRDTTVEMHGYSLQTEHMRALKKQPSLLHPPHHLKASRISWWNLTKRRRSRCRALWHSSPRSSSRPCRPIRPDFGSRPEGSLHRRHWRA